MKTNDLISLLATGQQPVARPLSKRVSRALNASTMVSLGLVLVFWGVNPRLAQLAQVPAFWVKLAWLTTLSVAGILMVQRLARPGMSAGTGQWLTALAIASMMALAGGQAAVSDQGSSLWMGVSWETCTLSIAVLALPFMAALMWTLRDMAPTRPALAGAASGLVAGALAALLYSIHCPEVAFPFLTLWYGAAIGLTSAVGALIGPWTLRW